MTPIYSITKFNFAYPEQGAPALKEISLAIERGQFVTVCGKSGSGKTTFLRQLKTVLAPHGTTTGDIRFDGTPLDDVDPRRQASEIGYVLQSPENQIVTDKVWHELAFGLESLGYDTPTIRLRVAEMAAFFGIEGWFHRDVSELSGGQKQLLNLASVMAMQPSVLLLDEPTSQLDPIAASDFLATVSRINRELGTTVLLTEHRLEEALPLSDRVVVMDGGEVIADGSPGEAGAALKTRGHDMFHAMPTPMRVYAGVENDLACPVTVREGRNWLSEFSKTHSLEAVPVRSDRTPDVPPAIAFDDVWFRYAEDEPDVLRGLRLSVPTGAFFAVVGGNGAGKSTMLSLVSRVNSPHRGRVLVDGRPPSDIPDREYYSGLVGVLPQNPQSLFVKQTVELDLFEMLSDGGLSKEEKRKRVDDVAELCELSHLLSRHPYDLSGGEQQRAALAKVLLLEPRILLLDEPTKGLDSHFKEKFAHILTRLRAAGATILMVSHDVEFCARHADRCALFFDGAVVSEGTPQSFFSGSSFYTTAANRMARDILPGAVIAEDIIRSCGGQVAAVDVAPAPISREGRDGAPRQAKPLPLWRKILGGVLVALGLVLAFWTVRGAPGGLLGDLLASWGGESLGWRYAIGALFATVATVAGAALLTRRAEAPPEAPMQTPAQKRKLPKRTLAATMIILLLIPLTLYVGTFYFGNRRYYIVSLLIVLFTTIPFFLIFEGRKPQARELVVIATLCAIAVAGRAAFFFLPQFKPVAALVIIAGVAFGGEAGFLTGAVSMLVSNVFFGQGPYTPFQMFAMGIIGFLAGGLFRKGVLRRSRVALCTYGGLSVFFIYGVIMNTYSVFQVQSTVTWGMILTSCAMGIPMDLLHAASTALFLWIAGPAMLEKLDRVKVKYGLLL